MNDRNVLLPQAFVEATCHARRSGIRAKDSVPRAMPMKPARIPTFVNGLDELLDGGIPVGHVVLVSGMPGTMKSAFTYAIMSENARQNGTQGLYISLEQTRENLRAQMRGMGFSVEATRGTLFVLDGGTVQKDPDIEASKSWIDLIRLALTARRKVKGLDLVAIDSLDALEVLAKFKNRRTEVFRLFEWLRDFRATTFVITESPSEVPFFAAEGVPVTRDEGFLADAIIELKMHAISETDIQRRIRVVKMRGARHGTGFRALVFEGGRFEVTQLINP